MRKFASLLIVPVLFTLTACGSKYPPHKGGDFCNVTFIGHDVTCNCPTYVPKNHELVIKLDIPFVDHEDAVWEIPPSEESEGQLDKPIEEYYVDINDIKITIAGKEYPDGWYFYYRHNDDNMIVIKKEYVVNDIVIEVTAHSHSDLFLYGIEIGDEMLKRWVKRPEEKSDEYPHDLQINLQTSYQREQQYIRTLPGKAFPVLEHDNIDITFSIEPDDKKPLEQHAPLPDDIRFRVNARYAMMGTDYTREYSGQYTYKPAEDPTTWITGYQYCHLKVPHYIVTDHTSFRQYGEE